MLAFNNADFLAAAATIIITATSLFLRPLLSDSPLRLEANANLFACSILSRALD